MPMSAPLVTVRRLFRQVIWSFSGAHGCVGPPAVQTRRSVRDQRRAQGGAGWRGTTRWRRCGSRAIWALGPLDLFGTHALYFTALRPRRADEASSCIISGRSRPFGLGS
jgi:hypothetical protein